MLQLVTVLGRRRATYTAMITVTAMTGSLRSQWETSSQYVVMVELYCHVPVQHSTRYSRSMNTVGLCTQIWYGCSQNEYGILLWVCAGAAGKIRERDEVVWSFGRKHGGSRDRRGQKKKCPTKARGLRWGMGLSVVMVHRSLLRKT